MFEEPQEKAKLKLLIGLLLAALAVWILYWIAIRVAYPDNSRGARGQFGDAFGAANALFSAFAFAGLIYTILLQRDELALQRHELKQTREVMKEQERQLAAQNATLRLQSFENTFFQLLRLHSDIAESISANIGGSMFRGREAFRVGIEEFDARYQDRGPEPTDTAERLERISAVYDQVYLNPQGDFGHYFRNLYRVVKFVDESDISDDAKKRYTGLIRAQLSRPELLSLFYNCLSRIGRQKFKVLIERYALLENMNPHAAMESHIELYEPSAYGEREWAL
jgi:hypothetical protein